ncbi:uncharacterized protein TNCV_3634081 [Trichonephila clavipes]|nr:uncharacterized protein TNCV_3634081 [Trichonephila clavipes]
MPLRRRRSHYQQLTEFGRGSVIGLLEGGFSFRNIEERLVGMYPLCMIVGGSGKGMVLLQEDWVPRGHRLKWADHLARMSEDRCCKKIFQAKPMGNKPRGRPPLKWIDCVEKDLSILKVENWKTVVKSRDTRKKLLEKARSHSGLSSN